MKGIDRETLSQLRHLLRPIATRVANSIARAVVQLVDDGKKLQVLQLGVMAGETIDDAEHHQPYGFSSVPLAGAEAVVVFPNGDRSHPLVIAASDRRHRPTGGQAGEVTVYNSAGARVILKADGTIEARSSSGTAASLATKADLQILRDWVNAQFAAAGGHTHLDSLGGPTTTITPVGAYPVPNPAGTTKLKGE